MGRTYQFKSRRMLVDGIHVLRRFDDIGESLCCESLSLEEFLQRDPSMWRCEMEATATRPMQTVYTCLRCGAARKVGAA